MGITLVTLAHLRDVDMTLATATDAAAQATLVRAAIAGDETAFATIIDRHRTSMTRVAYVVCGDADLAEEAVQSAWPIVWQRLSTVREADRLGAWLASVAVNEARQLVRRRHRRSVVEIAVATHERATAPDPSMSVADIDLVRALAGLAPEDRALLALRYVAGLNSFELGRAMGMSASGLRRRLARLLAILRTELGDA
jgi:RNA polymerase sigma factor (sigma-70 family)